MSKRDATASQSDETSGVAVESTRQPRVFTSEATLRVEAADGTREVRLLDFLRELADDGIGFERVGAMAVGDEVLVYPRIGRTITVRRIR